MRPIEWLRRTTAKPIVVAHRGGSLEAPENTLQAFQAALACGAYAAELDVTLSRDEEVVVIHDDRLERVSAVQGFVRDYSLAELREIDVGSPKLTAMMAYYVEGSHRAWPPWNAVPARIPTLREVLALPLRLMIEIKAEPYVPELVARVLREIEDARAKDRVVLASFSAEALAEVARREPHLPRLGIIEDASKLQSMAEVPVDALALRWDILELHQDVLPSLPIWAWTAYTVDLAESMAVHGADAVITDIPRQTMGSWLSTT